jgi:hypothetical protein
MTASLCTAASAQDVFTDVWTTINQRRTPVIQLGKFGYGDTLSPLKGLKLTDDSVVLTFEGSPPNRKPLFLLGVLCETDGETWFSDATLLRPDETAEEFVEANLRFVKPSADIVRIDRCSGGRWSIEQRTPDFFVERSEDRVIAHLNRWAWFLARYRAETERAGEFLTRSLTMQADALNAVISSPKINDLNLLLFYFDQTKPLAVLEAGVAPPQVDASILRRYLELTTRARRKLLAFKPMYREQFERESAMLEAFGKAPLDD